MHKLAADLMMSKHTDIGKRYAASSNNQRVINRAYLQKLLQNVIFLARQGLPFRGNWIPSEDGSGGSQRESNFYQLMLLRANDDPGMLDIMRCKTNKYTDHRIQDKLIKLLAHSHLRRIAGDIKAAGHFALEADEVTDCSNKEQVVVCLRWVDDKFEAHEDFVVLHNVDDITAVTIVYVITDTVCCMNLSLSMCRAQCNDGAFNMKRVAFDIQKLEPRALYLHSLNIAMSYTLKSIKCMCDILDIALEIYKLLKYSPSRDAIFHKLHQELTPQAPCI